MATNIEIERKFLVREDLLPTLPKGTNVTQAYIFIEQDKEMRVRISGQKCKMTIKITKNEHTREEFEYYIDISEGTKLIESASNKAPIEKVRYDITFENTEWTIDIFQGLNQGLVLAETELDHINQSFSQPSWLREEVTYDKKYYNSYLYSNPYSGWNENLKAIINNKTI